VLNFDTLEHGIPKVAELLKFTSGHKKMAEGNTFQRAACICMQRGLVTIKLSVRPTVRLSVCQSVWQTREFWQKNLYPHTYTTWKVIHPSFVPRRMFGGATPSTWNFGSSWPRWSENTDFQSIFARSGSAVTLSKKVSLTLIGSPRAFKWA